MTISNWRFWPCKRGPAGASKPAATNNTHHIGLDFGRMSFPVPEGQSIGILAPGMDASGRPQVARQYLIASPRNGEQPGYNNVSLTC